MTYDPRLSHFDLDYKRGAQGELLMLNVAEMLAEGKGTIEVKTDYRFLEPKKQRFYVERECRGRDGRWRPSGLAVSRATFWAFVLGEYPAIFFVATDWLRRATDLAAADERNHKECDYGENPTRGVLVFINHFVLTKKDARA
jgi:hypothetical protein